MQFLFCKARDTVTEIGKNARSRDEIFKSLTTFNLSTIFLENVAEEHECYSEKRPYSVLILKNYGKVPMWN